jgi:hypothetical protein
MWDCASQLWVPGRSRVHGRPYLSFCPITLQHFSFRSWWICRWMPIWKRSRLLPFSSGWSHGKGGLWGVVQGSPTQYLDPSTSSFALLGTWENLQFLDAPYLRRQKAQGEQQQAFWQGFKPKTCRMQQIWFWKFCEAQTLVCFAF